MKNGSLPRLSRIRRSRLAESHCTSITQKKQPDRSRGNHRVILLLSSFTLYMLFTSLLPYYLSPAALAS